MNPVFREISEEDKALFKEGRPLGEFMPIRFENGFTMSGFTICCVGCKRQFPIEEVKGKVTRPLETVADIKTFVFCEECKLFTVSRHRVRADAYGQRLEYVDANGEWVYQDITTNNRKGLWNLLKRMFGIGQK